MTEGKKGLVLSGGGARGIAHLGVLKLLDEIGVKISAVSGTSAGAIIGAFYTAGYKPQEILEIARSRKFFGFSNLLFGKAGFFDMKPFETVYREYFPHNLIERLSIPLHIAATDIIRGEIRYYSSGDLSMALKASSSVPMVFQPVEYDGTILLDGGILNNFPLEPLVGKCERIIGVNVNSLSHKLEEIHMKDMLDRSFHFALSAQLREKADKCNVFIEPPDMSRFGMFDLGRMDEVFSFSYEYASGIKDYILKGLE